MANSPQQVVFIDSSVPDIADLLSGLAPGEVAFVIDAASDGIQQIADILAANNFTDLAAISIVGHGASGAIDVGSTVLNDGDLSSHAGALSQIGAALSSGGSLQLYACDTASGAAGQQFIADLSSFVGGASVAASTQDIGQTATGENWTLDAIAGPGAGSTAQVSNPFTAAAEAKYSGTLSQPTTELWISGSAGGFENIILHGDDTGTGTASNTGTLFTPTSPNNPSAADDIEGLDLLQLDTENQKYFIATQNSTQTLLLEGSLSSALANPSGTPSYTTLFSSPTDNANGFALTGIADDPTSQQVFFDDGHSFYKVGYAGGAVTTLGSTGSSASDPFLDGLALDMPHHVAYFISATSVTTTSTTPGSSVHYNTTVAGSIYETSSLTAGSGTNSVTISKLVDVDSATYGAIWDGDGMPGIAVDTTTGLVYFTTHTVNGHEGGVFALDPNTQTITTLFRQGAGGPTGVLTAIQVDDATGKYYVSVVNPGGNGGAIYVGNLSGGTPTLFQTIPTFNGGTIDPIPNGFSLDNAPTMAVTTANTPFTESTSNPASANNTPVSVVSAANPGDTDNTSLVSATVTVGGLFAGDQIGFSTAGTSITASYNSSTGVLTLSGKDSLSNYQTVLDSVTFTSTSDNPTDFGSDTSRTFTWTVNDGLLTSAPQTATLSVVGVNDAPTLTGTVNASFTEGGAAVTLSPSVTVADPDSLSLIGATVAITGGTFAGDGDVLATSTAGTSITASYNAATETLTLTGSDTFAHYQQVLDSVTFVTGSDNPSDFGSAPTRTVTWTLNDGSASNATSSVTSIVSITAVNDPPTLAGTANASFTENGSPVTLSPAVTVSDPDNLTLAGATVAITGGTFAGDGDVLAANVSGTGITATYNAATERLVLSGTDSLAHYQQVLDSVAFVTASDNPDDFGADPTRTVTWTLNDGGASNNLSAVATTTVGITAVNDAPTLAGTTNASFTENGGPVALSPAAAATDPDSLTLAGATVALTGGTFAGDGDVLAANVSGTAITASYNAATETLVLSGTDTLAHYTQVLDSVSFATASDNPDNFGADPTRTVTWTLDDGSASNNVSAATTTAVSITAVNDAPTLAGTTNASFTENGAAVMLSSGAAVSDPDNLTLVGATVALTGGTFAGDGDVLAANVSGTAITASYNAATETLTLTGADTLAHYQQVLDSVTFVTASDNPDDFGSAPTRTVTWTLDDGSVSNATTSVTTTVSITAANDAPTLAGTANASYTENGAPVTLSPAAAVSDPDSLNLAGATVAITGGTFAGDGDVLSANVAGTAITASYNAATETLVLSGADTLAHYQQVLDSVAFSTSSDNPDDFGADPTRTVTWQVDDGSGSNNLSAVATTTIGITAVNDPPTLSNVAATAGYTEQAAATTLSGGLVVSDPDSLTLAGATVQIAGGTFAGDGDVLAANVSGTAITASYDSSTETLTLSGLDTVAHYQSVLDSVTFFDASDNPTNYGSNATRTLTWVVTDGSASSNIATEALSVTAVNDAPTLAGVPSTASFRSGQTVTLAPAASVSDPDNLTLANATVQITGGTFAGDTDVLAANVSGTNITATYNAATETLTLTGSDTLAHYGQVLDSVTFTTGANPTNFGSNPTRTVTWVVNDGSGSNNTATTTSTISLSTSLVKNDFDGDRRSDILFKDTNGAAAPLVYFMNGTTVAAQATLPNPGSGWAVIGSGDFNSDGKADIVWQNADGTPMIWTMNGSTVTSTTTLSNPGSSWHAIATGDFNGDGESDIAFQNSNGTPMIWMMNGTSVASTATLSNPGSTWELVATGDFNGDGKSDLAFQLPNGTPMIWEMNGTSVIATATLPTPQGAGSWPLIGTGDFDGDGHADLVFQKTNGTPMIWEMNGTSIVSNVTLSSPGANWQLIGTGDYNGDGKSDILFQNNDGTPQVWTMNGTTVTATATLANPGSSLHANTG